LPDLVNTVVNSYSWLSRTPKPSFFFRCNMAKFSTKDFFLCLLRKEPTWIQFAPNDLLGVVHFHTQDKPSSTDVKVDYSVLTQEQMTKAAIYLSHRSYCCPRLLFEMLPRLKRVAPSVVSALTPTYHCHDIMQQIPRQ
jgi:hypothetical protein